MQTSFRRGTRLSHAGVLSRAGCVAESRGSWAGAVLARPVLCVALPYIPKRPCAHPDFSGAALVGLVY